VQVNKAVEALHSVVIVAAHIAVGLDLPETVGVDLVQNDLN